MSILVSGSVALDHIMVFPDRFANHILPDQVHALNVSFNITSLDTHFGGVAANIAYHLRMLGADPLILAAVGSDFGPYAAWLDRHGIRRDGIVVFDDVRTPQGFVTTDREDCQIWAFYEGAMARAHEARVEDVSAPLELAIVSANGKRAMLEHARALKRRGVPTYIDPSHGLPILSGAELLELIDGRGRLLRERLRVEAHARADRRLRVGDRRALRERDHHLRRRGLRDPHRAASRCGSRRSSRSASSIRPAAATPIARASCSRSRAASRSTSRAGSGACSAAGRSRSRARRRSRYDLAAVRARYARGVRRELLSRSSEPDARGGDVVARGVAALRVERALGEAARRGERAQIDAERSRAARRSPRPRAPGSPTPIAGSERPSVASTIARGTLALDARSARRARSPARSRRGSPMNDDLVGLVARHDSRARAPSTANRWLSPTAAPPTSRRAAAPGASASVVRPIGVARRPPRAARD